MHITLPWRTLSWTPPNARLAWLRQRHPWIGALSPLCLRWTRRNSPPWSKPTGWPKSATLPSGGRPRPPPRQGARWRLFLPGDPPPRRATHSAPLLVRLCGTVSATDTFPDETPIQQRHQPAGDSRFSDIEDGGSDDAWVPAATAPPTAGHISSFLLRIRRRVLPIFRWQKLKRRLLLLASPSSPSPTFVPFLLAAGPVRDLARRLPPVLTIFGWQRRKRRPLLLASPSPPSPTVVPFPLTADPIRNLTRHPPPTPVRELALATTRPPTSRRLLLLLPTMPQRLPLSPPALMWLCCSCGCRWRRGW